MEVRDLIRQPLDRAELTRLADRVGGMHELIAPKRKAELSGLDREALLAHFLREPGHLRRPIIEIDEATFLGFAAPTKEQLSSRLKTKAKHKR